MIYKNSYLMIVLIALISGCASTPRVPIIDDTEAFKYERKYLAEYEQLKSNYSDPSIVKWIQPANKEIACKLYVGTSNIDDRTLDENYKIYWDGDCKNGYANGLGREFERGLVLNLEAIAIYHGKSTPPEYYIQTNNLENKTQEGDISNGYFVEKTIHENDKDLNFYIYYTYGYFGSIEKPALLTLSSPFSDSVLYSKRYPNFNYTLIDRSNDEFDDVKYMFDMFDNRERKNGFSFETPKAGKVKAGEIINDKLVRLIQLPDVYFNKVGFLQSEIIEAGQKAINAQNYALKVKNQYLSKICKQSVTVSFINNEEYKKICHGSEYFSALEEKINAKLTQINNEKQEKRERRNQQELINAQVSQADAAQRQADAVERANRKQSVQNLNNNLQMQQLNNNLRAMIRRY